MLLDIFKNEMIPTKCIYLFKLTPVKMQLQITCYLFYG